MKIVLEKVILRNMNKTYIVNRVGSCENILTVDPLAIMNKVSNIANLIPVIIKQLTLLISWNTKVNSLLIFVHQAMS